MGVFLMNCRELVALTSDLASRLCGCGAETRLIVQTAERAARACGGSAVIIVDPGKISIKVEYQGSVCETFVPSPAIHLNMGCLISYVRLCRQLEQGAISPETFSHQVKEVKSISYHPLLIIVAIGLATGAFSGINGGSLGASCVGILSGMFVMACRIGMHKARLFPLFIFTVCGFAGTMISCLMGTWIFNLDSYNLVIAMVVSLLPLIPGFPFINGVLDLFKGYVTMGISRLISTFMILFAVSLGIMMAFSLLPSGW